MKKEEAQKKRWKERVEALIRILVFIISGVILLVWRTFIYALVIISLIYTVFSGKRPKKLAELSEVWNTQWYVFQRYITFTSNKRPFPFRKLEKEISMYE